MPMLIGDPELIEQIQAKRRRLHQDNRDEVWDGDYVVSPVPNVDHQGIVSGLTWLFESICRSRGNGRAFPGINLSDRDEGWAENFRIPDVAVYLADNPAINHGAHWEGGPDLAVEILSPGDLARRKRDFYAAVGVREYWIIDRAPWAVELYRLNEGRLDPAGTATVDNATILSSEVMPVDVRLVPGPERPMIEVARRDNGEVCLI